MTNGDRIRQMSNEELANYIVKKMPIACCYFCEGDRNKCHGNCEEGIKAYLESEEE